MDVALIEPVVEAAKPWANLYNDSTLLQTGLLFVHFAGLLTAGGFAVATDRLALRISRREGGDRRLLLRELGEVHRPVMIGLAVVTLTGIAMALGDAEFLLASPIFWLKMSAFALLLVNGLFMMKAERRLRGWSEADGSGEAGSRDGYLSLQVADPVLPNPPGAWRNLRWAAVRSMSLWGLTLLLGTALTAV